MINDKDKLSEEEILDLWLGGWSYSEVANKFGASEYKIKKKIRKIAGEYFDYYLRTHNRKRHGRQPIPKGQKELL